jgi:hypothetical protein
MMDNNSFAFVMGFSISFYLKKDSKRVLKYVVANYIFKNLPFYLSEIIKNDVLLRQ